MFVTPSRLLTQGTATLVGLFAIGACEAPVASTDLRPAGDPEVLTVMVFNDAVDGVAEGATFCKVGDEKRPGFVGISTVGLSEQVCDDDLSKGATKVMDAVPTAWYVRVMFDELLDPDVEELTEIIDGDTNVGTGIFEGHIKNTKPVTIKCNDVDVPYDGYYSPSGNNVTWPVGPSLFIQPQDLATIPTSANCTLVINDIVVDKDGNKVPAGQAALPDYSWVVDPLKLVATDPAPPDAGDPPPAIAAADGAVVLSFNGFIDAASIAAGEVVLKEGADCATAATGTARNASVVDAGDGVSAAVLCANCNATAGTWNAGKFYSLTFSADAQAADLAGGAGPVALDLCFGAE